MPAEGVKWKPHQSILTFEEILRICRIMAELGITKIKLTGGEPLVRRGMAPFLGSLKNVKGLEKITLTTNGVLLGAFLDEAMALNIMPDGVNISMDALDPERYSRIARGEILKPAEILLSVDRLLDMGVLVKINCVPVRGFNEEDLIPLASLAKDKNIIVRFIELMPFGSAAEMKHVPGKEIVSLLEKTFGALTPFTGIQGNGPAVYYSLPGFTGKIGFINAVTHGFCETCNRLRLTSTGSLMPCLSYDLGLDLRTMLRSGASDEELAGSIKETAANKPQFHALSGVYGKAVQEKQNTGGMSGIGG